MAARRERVARVVGERGHIVIAELALELGVSEMTVRRDVAQLEQDGRVVSFYGGVRAAHNDNRPGPFAQRASQEQRAKVRIARRAAELVGEETAIAIDAGSTGAKLALELTSANRLRVVTASVPVITAFLDAHAAEVVALGGTLRRDAQSFFGPSTVAAASNLQVDTYFMGAGAASERGVFVSLDGDAQLKRQLMAVASRVVLLCDSTKFSMRAMTRVCGWDAIDVIVTDDRIDDDTLAMVRAAGVEMLVVPAG